jgi:hypothetical protein
MSRKGLAVLALLVTAAAFAAAAAAQVKVGGTATTRLRGFDEVPAISSSGGGRFNATINEEGTEVEWELSYFNLTGHVTQAHIHFAQKGVNGAIVVFLCSNLGNGPAGTAACPESPGTVSGTFTYQNVGAGANSQGIGPFELPALLRAIRAGIAYANVHSDLFPGGEIRGQLSFTPSD